MRTRIISAFPGTGKTYYQKLYQTTCLDSDSSDFSWLINNDGDKIRNPDFPENYIIHIKKNIGKYEIIFVSTHKEVRDALLDNCIFFYLVYPKEDMKLKYFERYKLRSSDNAFIKLLSDNWDDWIKECYFCDVGCKRIAMAFNYLESEIHHIIASEKGEVVEKK